MITGVARGQGRSHAVRLAEEGADIIALDVCAPVEGISYEMASPEELEETVELVKKHRRRVVAVKVDTRERRALSNVIDDAVAELGGLDIVVANAGVVTAQRWNQFTQQQWDATISVNVTGTWHTMVLGARHLIERGGGSIIVTSSVAGLVGSPLVGPYVAAKHAVIGLTRSFSNELAEHTSESTPFAPPP